MLFVLCLDGFLFLSLPVFLKLKVLPQIKVNVVPLPPSKKTNLFLDPWLHRKTKKNSKSKSQTGSPDITADPSYSALAAAGLKIGSLPWSIPTQKAKQPNGLETQDSWTCLGNQLYNVSSLLLLYFCWVLFGLTKANMF